ALTILLALTFTVTMLYVVKPQLDRLREVADRRRNGNGIVAGVLAFVFISAYFTEIIGIHALFGAFLAGVIMPASEEFRSFLREKPPALSPAVLLPLFFAFTGLRTQIGLLNDWNGWLVCLMIILVAIVGKLGGSMMAARWAGLNWADSFS